MKCDGSVLWFRSLPLIGQIENIHVILFLYFILYILEVADMTGENRTILYREPYVYISLALDDDHLYVFAADVR